MKKLLTLAFGLLNFAMVQAEEKTVWEGSEAISWNTEVAPGTQFETPAGTFTGLAEGDIIHIYTTTTYDDPQYVVTYKAGDSWKWTDLSTTVSEGVVSYTVASAQIATEIAGRGLILRGQAWTATKITIETEDAPVVEYDETTVWTGEAAISWSTDIPGTQFETPEGTFAGLAKGNIIKVYSTTTYDSPQYVVTYKAGSEWTWTDLTTTVADGVISYTVESDEIATEIAERGLILRGQAWTATKITVSVEKVVVDYSSITLTDTEMPSFVAGTYETVKVNRTLLEGFNSIILPFATTAAELTGSSAAYAVTLKEANKAGDELTFVKVDAMEANKPYLIYVDAETAIVELSDKELVAIPENYWEWQSWDYNGKWHLQGVYEPQSVEGKYVVSGANTLAVGGSSATIKGLRAYVEAPSDSDVKASIRFSVEDDETGIREFVNPTQVHGLIYNLAGQRTNDARHGIYIVGGKKIIK